MKKLIVKIMVMAGFLGIFGCSSDPSKWSDDKLNAWFEKGEWLNGWNVKPDGSVNRREFAVSYFKNKERWDKAFTFLKNNDLSKLEIKKYDIDGDNAYAPVSEYMTKNPADVKFEAHRKYIDIQHIINGAELMTVAPISAKKDEVAAYNADKDVEFMTVSDTTSYKATPENFFIFFPDQVHRPNVKIDTSAMVKKIVVKVKVD
jgi:YhcH/YjgK/YiaL family protein